MDISDKITHAIAGHATWKHYLRKAIESGRSEWTVEAARPDDRCEFGRWLHELPLAIRMDPHWKAVHRLHEEFHREAAAVLALALAGRREEAEAAIGMHSKFAQVSSKLTIAMTDWKRDSGGLGGHSG